MRHSSTAASQKKGGTVSVSNCFGQEHKKKNNNLVPGGTAATVSLKDPMGTVFEGD